MRHIIAVGALLLLFIGGVAYGLYPRPMSSAPPTEEESAAALETMMARLPLAEATDGVARVSTTLQERIDEALGTFDWSTEAISEDPSAMCSGVERDLGGYSAFSRTSTSDVELSAKEWRSILVAVGPIVERAGFGRGDTIADTDTEVVEVWRAPDGEKVMLYLYASGSGDRYTGELGFALWSSCRLPEDARG